MDIYLILFYKESRCLHIKKGPTICYCIDIDEETIVKAIKNGADTLSKVKETTSACTGNECKEKNPKGRCCSVEIKQLIKENMK